LKKVGGQESKGWGSRKGKNWTALKWCRKNRIETCSAGRKKGNLETVSRKRHKGATKTKTYYYDSESKAVHAYELGEGGGKENFQSRKTRNEGRKMRGSQGGSMS